MDNYDSVLLQMQAFGVEFNDKKDLPLQIPTQRRKTCGKGGKYWYYLQLFRPDRGGCFIVGKYGTYKHGGSERKVIVDWKGQSEDERARMAAERRAAQQQAAKAKAEAAELAALSAVDLWRRGRPEGRSPYLERKGVTGEACRYLPDGSLLVPLLRYDLPIQQRLRGIQRIYPGPRTTSAGDELPQKTFTKDFGKAGSAVRLGAAGPAEVVMICEGYATGLSIRQATGHQVPVYVALDAYNLALVVPIVRLLQPDAWLLICADDDWQTQDHGGANPGRRAAMKVAKQTERCDIVWPVFSAATRQAKDTDFNDLQQREGLDVVAQQLYGVMDAMRRARRGR